MEEFRLDCSKELASRFWALCKSRGVSPGQAIRQFMANEVEVATGVNVDASLDAVGNVAKDARLKRA